MSDSGISLMVFMFLSCGFILGANVYDNANLSPIEHKIENYCTDIGSELQSYDRDDELVCENGATFTYKLEDE
jgi:hypothetical protein